MSSIYEINIGESIECVFFPIERVIKRNTNDDKIKLTTTEAEMFKLLCSHAGKSVERAQIENEVWRGRGVIPTTTNLNQLVCTLRKKVKKITDGNIIITVPRIGFVLSDIVEVYPTEKNKNLYK
ncbi:helix-turn-helix domain-containing protein [Photobacterium makurazakiensis]|uniref:winged helix-turn-helix domain-containing protein n=1 Tax=Photobacterium makurazakiensis TaxID=2910234 RepID=UPI003D0CBF51